MHLVVTGAGGFIGARVALALARAGHAVTACYRNHLNSEVARAEGITLVQGDLADGVALPDGFDGLVHCAADIPGLCPDPERLTRSNVLGTEKLFTAARRAKAQVIVNLSSMSVYGTISVPEVTEDVAPDNPDVYGQSKLAAEEILQDICAETISLSGLSIRLPGIVGRGSHHNFLSGVMEKILAGEPLRAINPEALFNNIVFIEDLAAFIGDWLERAPTGSFVTNIAAREPMTIRNVVAHLYACAGRPPRVVFGTGDRPPFLISLDRAISLGYRPATVKSSLESFVFDALDGISKE